MVVQPHQMDLDGSWLVRNHVSTHTLVIEFEVCVGKEVPFRLELGDALLANHVLRVHVPPLTLDDLHPDLLLFHGLEVLELVNSNL